MNNFTKEELKYLYEKIIPIRHCHTQDLSFPEGICKKIQFMIDNFCAHDGEIGYDYPGEKCMKCHKMWE